MIWGRCIGVRGFDDGEVTDITTKASFAPDGVSSAGEAMAEGTPETPEEPKKEAVAGGEGEEKKEGDVEAKVEEVEEPDDTPVDLSEFWVKPDQVRTPSQCLTKLFRCPVQGDPSVG